MKRKAYSTKRSSRSPRKKWLRRIIKLMIVCFIAGLLWTGYVQWEIYSVQEQKIPINSDVGIVLGAALWGNVPSPALKERLNHAIKLYKENYFPKIIVSGGMDYNGSTLTEAEGMKKYLVEQGIPDKDIVEENLARNTYENLEFSHRLMETNGWTKGVVITHTYHGARALDMAKFIGFDDPKVSTMSSEVMWMPWHNGRETLAYTKWIIDKLLLVTKIKDTLAEKTDR